MYISNGSNKAPQVGTHRLVLIGIAAVTCRALKTWPGAAAVPLEHSHSGQAPQEGHCLSPPPLSQTVTVFLHSPSGFVALEVY